MTGGIQTRSRLGGRVAWALGVAIVAGAAITAAPADQQGGAAAGAKPKVRLNRIIENFEQGKPSFNQKDWRYIAMEHAPFSTEGVVKILNEVKPDKADRPKFTPVIRMPPDGDEDHFWMIKQVLDVGVMGIIVSHVQNKDEALKVVRGMRYPAQRGSKYPKPDGRRGWGPTAAVPYWNSTNEQYTLHQADLWPLNPEGELLAIMMCETRECIKNVNEILAVPGVAGVLIGPNDLAMDIGVWPATAGPEVEAATDTVAKACVAHKSLCGTFGSPDVKKRVDQGFRIFTGNAGNYGPGGGGGE